MFEIFNTKITPTHFYFNDFNKLDKLVLYFYQQTILNELYTSLIQAIKLVLTLRALTFKLVVCILFTHQNMRLLIRKVQLNTYWWVG